MEKNVWVKYNEYENKVNELLTMELGHSNRLSQDVMSKKPQSILQSLILLDLLKELGEIKELLKNKETNTLENKEVVKSVEKKEVKTTTKKV